VKQEQSKYVGPAKRTSGQKGAGMKRKILTAMDRTWIMLISRMKEAGKKTAGDSHFMSVLVTIIIVLVIAVLYRENISTIFTSFFNKATTQINSLFP